MVSLKSGHLLIQARQSTAWYCIEDVWCLCPLGCLYEHLLQSLASAWRRWHTLHVLNKGIHAVYEVSPGVRNIRNQDGGIVLDIKQGKIFRLNGIGALIFARLRQKEKSTQIIAEISRIYGISAQMAEADFVEFLDSLEKQGLVQRYEEAVPSCKT